MISTAQTVIPWGFLFLLSPSTHIWVHEDREHENEMDLCVNNSSFQAHQTNTWVHPRGWPDAADSSGILNGILES